MRNASPATGRLLLVAILSSGCWAAAPCPPCDPAAPPPAASPALPTCPDDAAPDPRVAERDRLVDQLRTMRESLAVLPSERASVLGEDATTALTRLRVMKLALQSLEGAPNASVAGDLTMLAALQRKKDTVARRLQEARARGLGDRHPDVRELIARVDRMETQIASQRETEQREIAALEGVLSSSARSPGAFATALRERFSSPGFTISNVSSFDPISMRLLALEFLEIDAEGAILSESYGSQHPRRIAVASKRDELLARFRDETRIFRSLIDAAGPNPGAAIRSSLVAGDSREERARELADQIALLSIRIVDTAAPEPGVPGPCVQQPSQAGR